LSNFTTKWVNMTNYIQRDVEQYINAVQQVMPVICITGMRQTGKSTLLQNAACFKDYEYFNFDDFSTLQSAKNNPALFLKNAQKIIIDEVQRFPEILLEIKQIVDKERIAGKFILSGSTNLLLTKNISETLAGRAIYLNILPFSHREISNLCKEEPFLKQVFANNTIVTN